MSWLDWVVSIPTVYGIFRLIFGPNVKPFDCDHGMYGECAHCISELEAWHHTWRLANDREYYMIYGPKVSLVKQCGIEWSAQQWPAVAEGLSFAEWCARHQFGRFPVWFES